MTRPAVCGFIAAEKTTYGVRRLCRVFGISRTSYYDWVRRGDGPTGAELDDAYAITRPVMRGWSTAGPTAPAG